MLKAKLVVVGGDAKSKEVSLRLPTVIGRGKDVSLTLPHPLVSRRHTEIFEKDGALYVKDLGSLNGTYVNNRRIKGEQVLPPNHLLTLGNVTFRAVYDLEEIEAPAAPSSTAATRRNEDETVNFEELDRSDLSGEYDTVPEELVEQLARKEALASQANDDVEKAPSKPVLNERPNRTDRPNRRAESPSPKMDPGIGNVEELQLSADGSEKQIPAEASSIFSGGEEFLTPEKSISVSALEALPTQSTPSSISFVGQSLQGIDGEQPQAPISSVDLDLAGDEAPASLSDPELGSFLKKIPR